MLLVSDENKHIKKGISKKKKKGGSHTESQHPGTSCPHLPPPPSALVEEANGHPLIYAALPDQFTKHSPSGTTPSLPGNHDLVITVCPASSSEPHWHEQSQFLLPGKLMYCLCHKFWALILPPAHGFSVSVNRCILFSPLKSCKGALSAHWGTLAVG